MRTALLLVALVGCDGDADGTLQPRGTQDCPALDSCALATNTLVIADAFAVTDISEAATVDSIAITPPGIIDATVLPSQSGVMLQARVVGQAHLHAVLHIGSSSLTVDNDLSVADIASTAIKPTVYPTGAPPFTNHIAAFAGASIELAVSYADAQGKPMLGSGIENWSTSAGQLAAAVADGPNTDSLRYRTLQLGTDAAVVTANAATLTIDARPASSTKQLDLGACAWLGVDGAILPVADRDKLDVVALADDGLAILGTAPSGLPVFTIDDPNVLSLSIVDEEAIVTTKQSGKSTLVHVSFDGATSTFTLGAQ